MTVQFLKALVSRPPHFPHSADELARRAEGDGWFGGFVSDTQVMSPETWLTVGQAIAVTSTLTVGVGVTNPSTRYPSVTASAAAAAQYYSGGRFILGFGRGDSAVHKVGGKPASLGEFTKYLSITQAYLRGEAAEADTEGVAVALWSSSIGMTPPPVDVSGTGPKVIEIGARLGDDVSFAVGAEPARVAWAVERARQARMSSIRSSVPMILGVYVLVVVTDDVAQGREYARGLAAIHHRFSAMNTTRTHDELPAADAEIARRLAAAYRASGHGVSSAAQAQVLDDDFLDRFAIIGPAGHCIERLQALVELGISRFWILPAAMDVDPSQTEAIYDEMARTVLPRLV